MIITCTFDFSRIPAAGSKGMIVRVKREDRESIDKAAAMLGMRQSQFTRFATVLLARAVLEGMPEIDVVDERPKVWSDLPPGVSK